MNHMFEEVKRKLEKNITLHSIRQGCGVFNITDFNKIAKEICQLFEPKSGERLLTPEEIKVFVKRAIVKYGNSEKIHEEQWDIDGLLKAQVDKIVLIKDAEWEKEIECLMEEALKVGRRDVVKWLNNLVVGQKLLSGEQAQAKLKDWGIEQPE